uniref:Uncharacterized protein n=1 Tax=Xanthomonas phage MK21 TaxID=3148942 RepID=A0AAU7J8F0_9CAUD
MGVQRHTEGIRVVWGVMGCLQPYPSTSWSSTPMNNIFLNSFIYSPLSQLSSKGQRESIGYSFAR